MISRRLALGMLLLGAAPGAAQAPDYEILAVRYGSLDGFRLQGLLPDAPAEETIDIALALWVIRDGERTVLFDSGFFREKWFERFAVSGFVRPDRAVARAGVRPEDVTDIVVSHAHWDHMGGIELFPNATVWIQAEEYAYYTGAAWQRGGNTGGIDAEDIAHLVARNMAGLVRLIDGDAVEIMPGITVFTGARHTYASQFIVVDGEPPWVLASDNAYLYRGLSGRRASATFSPEDRPRNLAAAARMLELAGDPGRVVPGHDAEQFRRFPAIAEGVVRIKP